MLVSVMDLMLVNLMECGFEYASEYLMVKLLQIALMSELTLSSSLVLVCLILWESGKE
jgi:hypothetical protein